MSSSRIIRVNGYAQNVSQTHLADLIAPNAQVFLGAGVANAMKDASQQHPAIFAERSEHLDLPSTRVRSASLTYMYTMPGRPPRKPSGRESEAWQQVAFAAGLRPSGNPTAMQMWTESEPAMVTLVIWREPTHTHEISALAARLEQTAEAEFGTPVGARRAGRANYPGAAPYVPPESERKRGGGGWMMWLVLLAIAAGAFYYFQAM